MNQDIFFTLLLSGLVLFTLILFYRLYYYFRLKKFEKFQYEYIEIPTEFRKKNKKFFLENSFKEIAQKYKKTNIDRIIFIHGTFAGNDPLYLSSTFEKNTPLGFKPLHSLMKRISKGSFDFLGQDKGNFTTKHVELIQRYFSQKASLFNWSGSNTHLARLEGAAQFILFLQNLIKEGENNFLIMAHSHGGQLLALITRFIADKELVEKLMSEKLLDKDVKESLDVIKKAHFSFVTMGTPVRYRWELSSKMQALHLINHRGKLPLGGRFLGSLWTRGGDYIQQYGGAGSDYYSVIDLNNKMNKKLKEVLQEQEVDFLSFLKRKDRLHNQGKNLLIDYKDDRIYPNFYLTVFGHAIYTRYYLLPFHLELIQKKLNL